MADRTRGERVDKMLKLTWEEIAIFRQALKYIEAHYIPKRDIDECLYIIDCFSPRPPAPKTSPFCESLLAWLHNDRQKLWKCCRKACIKKSLFEQICSKTFYPPKESMYKLIVAAEMDADQAKQTAEAAGKAWDQSDKFDLLMMFFCETRQYDFRIIQKLLLLLDLLLLNWSFV